MDDPSLRGTRKNHLSFQGEFSSSTHFQQIKALKLKVLQPFFAGNLTLPVVRVERVYVHFVFFNA